MNLPNSRLPNLPPNLQEEVEKQINYAFELGNRLFNIDVLERNTRVLHQEVSILNVIQLLGETQDTFRKKYLGITENCLLTKLIEHNLKLRSSINGWRSEQLVQILQSPKIENQQYNMPPDRNIGTIKKL